MVQDTSSQTIPDELYNLTQLAEVTLAAGRLRTTNVTEITEYIKKEKSRQQKEEYTSEGPENKKIKSRKKCFIDSNWSSQNIDVFSSNFGIPYEEHSVIKRNHVTLNGTSTLVNKEQQNIFSSSDDDSSYYSHKIFDRKKCRRFTISDNSKYDELSCSSIPSSGDEHCSSHSNKNLDQNVGSQDDDHICPECGKKYSTSSNLARHRQTHRSILDKKARRCPHCEKVYVSMPAYSMHVRTHNQGCECPHCGKCFSRPWLLQGHIRTHTGEKPFKCNICTKAFADKSNLRAHIQTHSNTKPHSCSRCGKAFALKSYLYKHEESSCMRNHLKQDKDRNKMQKSEIAKSSLASKLLRKDSSNSTGPDCMQFWQEAGQRVEQNIVTEDKTQKSYTNLTSPMSQEDFDRFTRISVIRPPISNQNFESSSIQMNFYQENPVDFSPKNNFSHSNKTSPFELTNNYAIVA